MSATLPLLVTLVICAGLVRPLARARWVWRAPHIGIALWQLLAATCVLCAAGTPLAIGLSAYDPDIPTALARWGGHQPPAGGAFHLLVTALGLALAAVLRTRRRHRRILALVARHDPAAPGAVILDHPTAVAYCLPGLRSRVVLSSAALRVLSPDQVAAVLAHERATHANGMTWSCSRSRCCARCCRAAGWPALPRRRSRYWWRCAPMRERLPPPVRDVAGRRPASVGCDRQPSRRGAGHRGCGGGGPAASDSPPSRSTAGNGALAGAVGGPHADLHTCDDPVRLNQTVLSGCPHSTMAVIEDLLVPRPR